MFEQGRDRRKCCLRDWAVIFRFVLKGAVSRPPKRMMREWRLKSDWSKAVSLSFRHLHFPYKTEKNQKEKSEVDFLSNMTLNFYIFSEILTSSLFRMNF